jgi:opacity protein-like surface antigen
MIATLLFLLMAQAGAEVSPPAQPKRPDHGWLIDLDLGVAFGYYRTGDSASSAVGPALTVGFHAGYRFVPPLAFGVHVLDAVELGIRGGGDTVKINFVCLGPELSIFRDDWTFALTALLLAHTDTFISSIHGVTSGDVTGHGVGFSIRKESSWGPKVSGGFMAQVVYATLGEASTFNPDNTYTQHTRIMLVASVGGDLRF